MKRERSALTEPDLVLFGGGFAPPHLGHVNNALKALSCFPQAQLLIEPNLPSPDYTYQISSSKLTQATVQYMRKTKLYKKEPLL